uniref:DNA mismatch repair proteins mutS family domain-containing protein n=1 Tax=viral metagenome TaxID=1070528 RepID=A0A6C0KXC6_9ZZZZ
MSKLNSKTTSISKIEFLNEHFKLPIYYNANKMDLKNEIKDDLELIKTIDNDSIPMLEYAFQPKNILGKKVLQQFANNYTTDTEHLKDTQNLLKNYKNIDGEIFAPDYNNIVGIWNDIKNDNGFKERYRYIEWPMWEFLNKNESFLQIMSIYDLSSPILSLLTPIIILIIPFFVLKVKGMKTNWSEYIEILKKIISTQPLGRLFTQFNSVKMDQKIYLILSAAFYLFTIYQNILSCMRFHNNMHKIHSQINDLKVYIKHSLASMKNYLNYSSSLKSYNEFNENVRNNIKVIEEIEKKLDKITPWEFSFSKIGQLGNVQKYFYELYCDENYNNAIMYSLGFNGYIDNITGIIENINDKKINLVKFSSKNKENKKLNKNYFKNAYYPALINNNPVKNTYKFKKNMIITGPNASGKTTNLKSALINVFISQQMGCGFYESAYLIPYKYIHCYLNIPDTSGRDSLFQAEARRCKEIIDIIDENKKETHFCAFDELYSGTNPDEAVMSANAFMEYLIKNTNVTCILTTHFIKLCNYLDKNKNVENYHMKTKKDDTTSDFTYLYKLEKGISNIRGGIKVLSDMNYPKEILENTKNFDL